MLAKKCKKANIKGGILEPISFDLDAWKYFDERNEEETKNVKESWDFPGSPVVKNPSCNTGNVSSIPGRGTKIPRDGGARPAGCSY